MELENKEENNNDFISKLQQQVIDKEVSLDHYNELINKENK